MSAESRVVSEVMQKEVVTLAIDERLDLAGDIMRLGRVRHLPVLRDGRLVGLVSSRELFAASLTKALDFEPTHRRAFLRSVEVEEVMTRKVVSTAPEKTLRDAAELMLRHKIGCLPVVEADRTLVGLVTESDLLSAALVEPDRSGAPMVTIEAKGQRVMKLEEKLERDMEALRRTRDELRVQVHLARAEAKELWDDLEHKFHDLDRKSRQIARKAEEPAREIGRAAKGLLDEVREGYEHIRKAL